MTENMPPPDAGSKPSPPSLVDQILKEPDSFGKVVKSIEEAFDHYAANREKHRRALATAQAKTVSRIMTATLTIVGLALVATAVLAYRGTISGEAFTFVAGTVVGSLIAFLAEHVAPNLYIAEPEED
jgi:hypothetical protein